MRKFTLFLAFLFFVGLNFAYAQTRTIKGTVTSADNGQALPGVTVQVKGTTQGTITDLNGKYSINVNLKQGNTLVFSFVGMGTQEIVIGKSNTINVVLKSSAMAINEVVVTALGITREKKALGYATQQVGGDVINQVKSDNVINSLSGRVSGVNVKTSGNFGGGTNVVIRGIRSLTGNNQPLFVVDGVPVSDNNSNSSYQSEGGQGYDFGTVASDIDPADIKSVNILKGAAATALYGSRAANGVIMITTKSGSDDKYLGKHGLGVSFSSNITIGTIDKSTFPTYQHQYGAGYGPFYSNSSIPYLYQATINGQTSWLVPTTEDASYGAKFDPNLMVYQWDAFVPESPNFGKATPWVAAKNGPASFFQTAVKNTNTISLSGVTPTSSFRLSYTNFSQTGVVPNSEMRKNSFSLNATQKLAKNLSVSANANFVHQYTRGRNGTGYNGNFLTSFRQWWEVNVDVKELKALYEATKRNVTWNMNDPLGGDYSPIYWNNFYWERFNNYENDSRDHLFGNVQMKWNITDYLSVVGRASVDTYNTLQEEHLGIGGVPATFGVGLYTVPSGYSRRNISYMESIYNLMLNFTKNLTSKLNLKAMAGAYMRRDHYNMIYSSTNGGLLVPGIFAVNNSNNPILPPDETQYSIGVNSLYGSVSLGYNNLLYLDATLRGDRSSTLPINNDTYMYPSVSGSFIFSNLLHADWLPFGKVRLNYAEVGNSAPPQSLIDTYNIGVAFGSSGLASVSGTKNNANLKPERTRSWGAGLTLDFLHKRLNFDGDVYLTKSIDQIMPVSVTAATGYNREYVNAGSIQNKGVELNLHGIPVQNKNFQWDINVNWTLNRNKVLSLYENHKNLVLASYQGGITIDAHVGQPYGVIEGNTFKYKNGQKVVYSDGSGYATTASYDNVLGNTNPLWQSGITNSFRYKNWTLSFLIDISKGGSVFSLDQYYGQADGIYPGSAGNNAKGNPKRSPVSQGGGVLFPGVHADGTPNTTYVEGDWTYAGGYLAYPNAQFVYDASYVKLREAQLSYRFPERMVKRLGVRDLTLGFVGNNLWIIFKKLPMADPEAGLGTGNLQGWQSGVMPTVRNFGFNLNVKF